MYERTDGSSYKRPNVEGADAASAINDRNAQIKGLLNDDPNALEGAPAPTPTPTPAPKPQSLPQGSPEGRQLQNEVETNTEALRQEEAERNA